MSYEITELSGGRQVKVYGGSPWPIQKYTMEWEGNHPRPVPPTKKAKTADGTEDTFIMRRDPKYLAALEKWTRDREIAQDVPLLINALKDELPDEETLWRGEWVERHKALSLSVPDDPIERKYEYLRTEVLQTDLDLAMVGTLARLQTFPQEEAIRARMRGFISPSMGGLWTNTKTSLARLLSKVRGTNTPG